MNDRKKLAKNKEKARQEKEQGEHQRMIERLTIEKKVELQKQLNSIRQVIDSSVINAFYNKKNYAIENPRTS